MDVADRIVECAVRIVECADRRGAVGDRAGQAAPAWYQDPTGRYEQRYWDGARWTDHVSTGGKPTVDAVDRSATTGPSTPDERSDDRRRHRQRGRPTAMAPFSGGAYVVLIIATLLHPASSA